MFPRILRPVVSLALRNNKFPSIEWIKDSMAKRVVIAHGKYDEIVPISLSKKLFDELDMEKKTYIEMNDATHNDIVFNKDLHRNISKLIK